MGKVIVTILILVMSFGFAQENKSLQSYEIASKLYNQKQYNEVVNNTTISINELTPNDFLYEKILVLRTLANLKLKHFNDAITDYKKLIELNTKDLTYYVGISYAYSELKDFEQCYLFLDKAYKVNPKDEYLLFNTARFHNIGKDYKEAIRFANLALELNLEPHWKSVILTERSKSYVNLKIYENALSDSDNAISYSPKYTLAYYYRALANIGLNKLETVCSDLEKAKNYLAGNLTKELIKQYCEK